MQISKAFHKWSGWMNGLRKSGCLVLMLVLMTPSGSCQAQEEQPNKKRLALVGTTAAVGYTGLLIGLNQAWYANYPRSRFHFFNDNREWLQMDKAGHLWASYAYGLVGIEALKWAGMERKKAIWIGGLAGTLFQTPIEILDGFSAQWGASPGDLIANSLGSALVISQELLWDEQRLLVKFSSHLTSEAQFRPNVLGSNPVTRLLKDYNGQTYWLSVSPAAFMEGVKWPEWLCLSLGYGAGGMLGGYENYWTDSDGVLHDHRAKERYREWYLSVDIDLQKIPVESPALKRLFRVVNCIKIPAPAVSWSKTQGLRAYPVYF